MARNWREKPRDLQRGCCRADHHTRAGLTPAGTGMLPERLYMSINPYMPGISGNQPAVESILDKCTGEEELD